MERLCYSFFKQVRIQRFIFIALVVLTQAGLIFSQSSPKPMHADEHKTILKFGGDHNYPPTFSSKIMNRRALTPI